MFIQPIYNILLLPDITYYFKKDFFAERSDKLQPGEDGSLTAYPHLRLLKAFTGFIFLSIFEFILARYL